ncbi:hypothetical protein EV715DRAFT_197471, partial [Schizophyllum commune]
MLTVRVPGHQMSAEDMDNIRAFNYKVAADLSGRSYDMLRRAFPDKLDDLLSQYRLQKRVSELSGITSMSYDCCVGSCCCFTGPYESLDACPYCQQSRYDTNGKPRASFDYIPIIPRLAAMFLDKTRSETMQYRHNYQSRAGRTADVFDSENYEDLRHEHVTIGGDELPHKFFEFASDVALGISTDGFAPFKRRKQTC